MNPLKTSLCILFLLLGFAVSAQQNNFITYSIEDGLAQTTVHCVIQDSRGYLWMGTEGGGLCSFDGASFNSYTKNNGLAGNTVRDIMEASDGNLWIGTEAGITVYDGNEFHTIDHNQGLPELPIVCLFEDRDGIIWVGTANGGLCRIEWDGKDNTKIRHYSIQEGLNGDFIFDITQDNKGRLWIGYYGFGISCVQLHGDSINVKRINRFHGIPSDNILTIANDRDGNLWFGTYDQGAFKMIIEGVDSGNVTTYNPTTGFPGSRIWSIHQDSEGNIWMGTDQAGIQHITNGEVRGYTKKEGLPENQILCVFEDDNGILWAGTAGAGLVKFNGAHFSHYSVNEGLPNNVTSIIQDLNGAYWFSSREGLTQMNLSNDQPAFYTYSKDNGLPENQINDLALDMEGNIWLATDKGIARMDPPLFKNINPDHSLELQLFTSEEGLIDNVVNSICIDNDGRVWCGTRGGVSELQESNEFVSIKEEHGLPHNEVQAIIQDRQGIMWIGTLNGLASTNRQTMTTYDEVEGLYDKNIYSLTEGPLGNIWIGTFGGGLYKLDVHTTDSIPIKRVADDSLLSSNIIYSLSFQDENHLLVGTEKGMDKITLDEKQRVLAVKSYSISDGFIGQENNQNAIYKDDNGDIWLGTVKGVTRYSPQLERPNELPPRTHITGLKLFFEEVDWENKGFALSPWAQLPQTLELPHYDNHLTFDYTGISLNNPNKVMYKFKMDGLDATWSPPRKGSEAIYSGLKPGRYTFNVSAVNENGVWNPKPTQYNFVITPPFWQTWWFYLLCTVFIIIVLFAFVKWREEKLKKEKAILEGKVEERTRELAAKNKEITDSINYAENIQKAILPSIHSIESELGDSFVLFRPRDIVSGDFYWYASMNGKVFIAACDCTGHGVPGAFVSMIGNNLLNQIILEKKEENPGHILTQLNQGVKAAFTKEGEQAAQDGMDMVLSVLDNKNKRLEYAGANNTMIFVKDGELEVLKGDRTSIGGDTDRDFEFQTKTIQFNTSDRFYMFSDGFQDQFGGPKGKKFMIKRYKQLILENHAEPMKVQKAKYEKTLVEWMGRDYDQIDDVLMIGFMV